MIFGASRPRRASRTSRTTRRVEEESLSPEDLPPKLIPSLRLLVSTAVSLVHTRLSLAGIELEEELQRLIGAAALALIVLILVVMTLIVGTFTIVLAVPAEYRVATMFAITVGYALAALIIGLQLKSVFTNRPPIFGATLAEIEKDKETLSQMSRAHEAAEEARERAAEARAREDDALQSLRSVARRTTTEGVL
jgi:uncharacterized membrane protein YqjE